jgi:hypothetical protein
MSGLLLKSAGHIPIPRKIFRIIIRRYVCRSGIAAKILKRNPNGLPGFTGFP